MYSLSRRLWIQINFAYLEECIKVNYLSQAYVLYTTVFTNDVLTLLKSNYLKLLINYLKAIFSIKIIRV